MSKSEGNVTTIREVLDEWGAEAFLLFLMTGHWRRPIEFSADTMAQAVARAQTFRNAFTLTEARPTVMCKVVSAGQYVERSSKWPQRALWAACHLKFERARLNFGAWSFPRHSDRASVSFACLPEVLDELRMSFRILDVEVGAQRSQPCGKHLRGI